ncbi:MAG: Uma2 family endonuclease [Geitlerinemataceae cyanobacterium]
MTCTIELRKIDIAPGQVLTLREIDWAEFDRIAAALGDRRTPRLTYSHSALQLRMPSPEHESIARLLGMLVTVWLEALDCDWVCLGSTTFRNEAAGVGVEPDDCFYLTNLDRVVGKARLGAGDPPPDLAIEVDITSPSSLPVYSALGVREVWRYRDGRLEFWVLAAGKYRSVAESEVCTGLPVAVVSAAVARLGSEPMSRIRREFADWVGDRLG